MPHAEIGTARKGVTMKFYPEIWSKQGEKFAEMFRKQYLAKVPSAKTVPLDLAVATIAMMYAQGAEAALKMANDLDDGEG